MKDQGRLVVIGIGPGDPEYLTLRGLRLLEEAEYVAGFPHALHTVKRFIRGTPMPMTYRDQEEVLATLGERVREGKRCVLCVWGDPSVSAGELLERARRACGTLEVVAGVSSLAVACARAGLAWEEALFISLHRRTGVEEAWEELREALRWGRRHVLLFPCPPHLLPAALARRLLGEGFPPHLPVTVYERLTLEGEREERLTLEALARREDFGDMTILLFPRRETP